MLTEAEVICGVTRGDVEELRPRVLVLGESVYLPGNTGPALAGAVAREALGAPVDFVGINKTTGFLIYRKGTN